ncbi:DNA-binding SARP family transcriptional activator [Nocardia tenerifensis]|uniref:DNA-binding SARP family transcriptional activator n=1 Tax=Nocardia tenerifensis TaxID=228006 RepID=A0A318K3Q9_9NOCA|nr:DNA-binding SARP family transcriptional activator [Nocardia tenerifensis]
MTSSVLRLDVLGPVEVRLAERRLSISAPQTLAVLAILAAESGRTLSTPHLAARLWSDRRPTSAFSVLRNHVHELRRHFGAHGHAGAGTEWLTSTVGGYRLALPVQCDAVTVQELLAAAESDRASGAADLAHEKLAAAKRLWRGDPLVGVPGPWADKERARLGGLRSALAEAAIAVTLDLGRYSAAVAELEALVAAEPQVERWHELMMVALYRAGRRIEALEVYRNAHRMLADELGLEPGPRMSRLHQEILSATPPPTGTAETPSPEKELHSRRIPAWLPTDITDFVGRDELVSELTTVLGGDGDRRPVVAITGMGGVGKTALAVHLAHQVRRHYPDGVLYLDLGGLDERPRSTDLLMGTALRAFGFEPSELPLDSDERKQLWRNAVANKRALLLLDNAPDVAHLAPLLPGPGPAAVLVTSRSSLAELFGARLVPLDVLAPDAAWKLLAHRASARRLAGDPTAAREILRGCGHLPLALCVVGARLASRPTWPLAGFAERLADEHGRLAELTVGGTSVEHAFLAGFRRLDPELSRAFVLIANADAPELPVAAVAALLDRDPVEAERLCETLVDAGLLQTPELGRYRYHDLLRLFGRKVAEPEQRREWPRAMHRLIDFYLASVKNVMALRDPNMSTEHYAATGAAGQQFTTQRRCTAWITTERAAIAALHRQVADAGDARTRTLAADLALALAVGGDIGEHRPLEMLSRAAEADGDRRTMARARLAAVMTRLIGTGDLTTARTLREVSATLLELGDHSGATIAEVMLGTGMTYRGKTDAAMEHYLRAIDLADQEQAASPGLMWAAIAGVHCTARRWPDAVQAAEQALSFAGRAGSLRVESMALQELALATLHSGDPETARALCEESLDAARRDGRRDQEGRALARRAEIMLATDDAAAAAPVAEAAVQALTEVPSAIPRLRAMQVHARTLLAIGRPHEAIPILEEVAATSQRIGVPILDAATADLNTRTRPRAG